MNRKQGTDFRSFNNLAGQHKANVAYYEGLPRLPVADQAAPAAPAPINERLTAYSKKVMTEYDLQEKERELHAELLALRFL